MQSKGNQPNKAQKDWREHLRKYGCFTCQKPAQMHHIFGATARNMGIPIGHWALLPLCEEHHVQVGRMRKQEQIPFFRELCVREVMLGYELPFGTREMTAIWSWKS